MFAVQGLRTHSQSMNQMTRLEVKEHVNENRW